MGKNSDLWVPSGLYGELHICRPFRDQMDLNPFASLKFITVAIGSKVKQKLETNTNKTLYKVEL